MKSWSWPTTIGSFLPRLVVTLGVLIFAGKWMLTQLVDFTVQIFQQAAALVG